MTSQYSKKQYNNSGNQNSYEYRYPKYKPGNLDHHNEFLHLVLVEDLKHIHL